MTQDGDYPAGAQYDPRAPYNKGTETKEIEVTISETLSTTRTIDVPIDAEEYNLEDYVKEQITLPSEEFLDWCVDDFTVIEE